MEPSEISPLNYSSLLELDLTQLIELESRLALGSDQTSSGVLAYRDVLIAYFRGSAEGVLRVITKSQLPSDFLAVAQLRSEILSGLRLEEEMISAEKSLKHIRLSEARAELLFCLTIAGIKTGQYEEASRFALLADHEFLTLGLAKKAVKSSFNYLIAQTHLFPSNRFFSDYSILADRAELVGEWAVMVAAQLNISREFQKVGALEMALESANKAVVGGKANGEGTRELGFARLQKASVLNALKRPLESAQELALASMIDHPEIAAAVAESASIHRLARFREAPDSASALGSMEAKLIETLRTHPAEFNRLADTLYPEVQDVFSQRERLKNLIARVRKKQPGLIIREAGCYKLSELRKC